jgi:hypothetical protein
VVGVRLLQQSRPHPLVQGVADHLVVQPGHRRQHVDGDGAAHHGGDRQHLVGLGAQARHASAHHVAHPLRDVEVDRVGHLPAAVDAADRTGLDEVTQHLADEEGVALGLTAQHPPERLRPLVELVPRGLLEDLEHLLVGQADER